MRLRLGGWGLGVVAVDVVGNQGVEIRGGGLGLGIEAGGWGWDWGWGLGTGS